MKRQLRCAPSAARVMAPRFLTNAISTSRFASGDAKIVLLPSRPGKLPPPLAQLLVATMNCAFGSIAAPLYVRFLIRLPTGCVTSISYARSADVNMSKL